MYLIGILLIPIFINKYISSVNLIGYIRLFYRNQI